MASNDGAVAIIPARGGSKRIPRKNVRPFLGRPMITYPISAATESGLFDRIVVSTDDTEIAEIAIAHGAEVPFTRAASLADDHTGTTEVMEDAIRRLGLPPEQPVCCLYPTAVFVTGEDLAKGFAKLMQGATWVLSLGAYPTPIDRAYRQEGDRFLPRQPDMMPMRSQDLEPAYFDAGQAYWAKAATWADPDTRPWDGADGVILPPERCVDIDTADDWDLAEVLYARWRGHE